MISQFSRTQLLFGSERMERLASAHVIVFGVGGVGGYVIEALARGGIGAIDIVDNDTVCLSNLNRQLYALHSTIGQYKVDVAAARVHDINPACRVTPHRTFFLPETADDFDFSSYDYAVDCIDTVSGKIQIIMQAKNACIPVISSMGTGNKLDPTMLELADIADTSVCPLARVVRQELRKRGVEHVKVVYSREPVMRPLYAQESGEEAAAPGRRPPGSTSFVPPVAGLIIAGEVIKDLAAFHAPESL